MSKEEAREWLLGNRSMTNIIPIEPQETFLVRVAEADAAMTQIAYLVLKTHKEGLLPPTQE